MQKYKELYARTNHDEILMEAVGLLDTISQQLNKLIQLNSINNGGDLLNGFETMDKQISTQIERPRKRNVRSSS